MDLTKLSPKQLEKLQSDLSQELASRKKQKHDDALKAAEAAANKHGFSLAELMGGKSKQKKAKAKAKYRNPSDPSQNWSGRGRQPQWFKDALASGTSPDDMAI